MTTRCATFTYLRIELSGTIATVHLERPPVNAVTQPMYVEIAALFSGIREHLPGVRGIVLTGSGRHFCGGNDLREFTSMDASNAPARMKVVREAFFAIRGCVVPVVAAVRGAALGTGLALAASCDVIVASEEARFGLPEVGVGLMGGARHLARLVPEPLARLMFLTADPVSAPELARYGGIADVVPDDLVVDRASTIARRIVRHSPYVLEVAKRSLNDIEHLGIEAGYEREQDYSGEIAGSPDAREAAWSVLERRDPSYGTR